MNSAPVEGAERIRTEADPNRGPRPELFKGEPRLPSLCARTERTKEGLMKAAVTITALLVATPALADPGHFAQSHGHNHWATAGALALAAAIGAVALWKSRKAKKTSERQA